MSIKNGRLYVYFLLFLKKALVQDHHGITVILKGQTAAIH